MSRARNIKPAIMDNEELAELEPLTRLLFIYSWMLADRAGRLEDRPKRIAAKALPYDREADVDAMLDSLANAGFIQRYEASGIRLIQIVNFAKHQTPHVRESESELPDCVQSTTKVVPEHNQGNSEASPRSPDSLIPDSLIPDSLITEPAAQNAGKPAPTSKPDPKGSRLKADWALPRSWGDWALNEFPHWTAETVRTVAANFADHWHGESGAKARKSDWLATWRKWCRSDITQRAHPPPKPTTETDYQRAARVRAEEAAGSLAHIVAAKAPGAKPEPATNFWEQPAGVNDATESTTTALIAGD